MAPPAAKAKADSAADVDAGQLAAAGLTATARMRRAGPRVHEKEIKRAADDDRKHKRDHPIGASVAPSTCTGTDRYA